MTAYQFIIQETFEQHFPIISWINKEKTPDEITNAILNMDLSESTFFPAEWKMKKSAGRKIQVNTICTSCDGTQERDCPFCDEGQDEDGECPECGGTNRIHCPDCKSGRQSTWLYHKWSDEFVKFLDFFGVTYE